MWADESVFIKYILWDFAARQSKTTDWLFRVLRRWRVDSSYFADRRECHLFSLSF